MRNTDLDGNEYFFDLVFSSTDLILQEILPRIILKENVSDCMPISPNRKYFQPWILQNGQEKSLSVNAFYKSHNTARKKYLNLKNK